ncbi:hypothetical protein N1E68_19665, partial [Pseudomonas aeruginosa]|nr:hypothetical protein [Pseudomonas aeruginosa]
MTILFLFLLLFLLMFIGVPIAVSLGLSGALTILLFADSTPFGHSAHADPDTCSTLIRTGS